MKRHLRNEQGFISTLLGIIGALVLLQAVFHVDVIAFLRSPSTLEVFNYLKRAIVLVWDMFLVLPVSFVWDHIVIGIFWKGIVFVFDLLKGWVDSNA